MVGRDVNRSRRSAVFSGVARNCASYLPAALANLSRLESTYETVRYVFAVGESNDNTLEILENWVSSGRIGHVIDMANLERSELRRTVRIAMARNACLSLLRDKYQNFDHLVTFDLDSVLSNPVCELAFSRASHWLDESETRAGVFANAYPRYYDLWALRHPRLCPGDVWHAIWDRHRWCSFELAKLYHVYSRQIRIARNLAPFQVTSAFGGLSIYKVRFTKDATYIGYGTGGREQAEHVEFNKCIIGQGGELFVFPSLLVRAPQEHLFNPFNASAWLKWAIRVNDLRIVLRQTWQSRA